METDRGRFFVNTIEIISWLICPVTDRLLDFVRVRKFLKYYSNSEDAEIKEIKEYIQKKRQIRVFNYPFIEKYKKISCTVCKDKENRYYVPYHNHKMYFKRDMPKRFISYYFRVMMMEQDLESPHRYLTDDFTVDKDSVVVDAGVAEGNFSLAIIDKVRKIILVECDEPWIEALRKTFYAELKSGKIEIIPKKLGKSCSEDTVSLDYLYEKYGRIDLVKMDIEGGEQDALLGGNIGYRQIKRKNLLSALIIRQQLMMILEIY